MGQRKKAPGTFYFEPALLERLKNLSERTKVPQSVYVRDAVAERVTAEEQRLEESLKHQPRGAGSRA